MNGKKNWLYRLIAALFFITAAPGLVYGAENSGEPDGDTTLAPYFFIQGGDQSSVDSLPLKATKVTANINGVIADIYVTQTYANKGDKPISATYVFPASSKDTVHGMKMQIGDRVVTAQIKERETAKQEYAQAEKEGKNASLLEEERPNVFTMNVANIMPGDTAQIELHYTEMVAPTDGVYQFVFPTVVGPRYANTPADQASESDQWVASPYLKDGVTPPGTYNITVNVSAGVPIADLTCTSHDVHVQWNGTENAQVTLAKPQDYAGNRDFILNYKLTGQELQSGLMLSKGNGENFFMLMVQPPERFQTADIPPREYIFVLDVSGSMEGYPLDTAKELIKNLLTGLRQSDSFNLLLFSGASEQMAPQSVPATEANIGKAINLIDCQEGGGGTELAPALAKAIAIPREPGVTRSVITITDGYIDGEKGIFDIIRENLSQTNFFSFGIGTAVNRYLIDGIAKAGQGESFVVTEPEEAKQMADHFRTYVQSPLLTDIQVTYNGFDAYDVEPPNIPTLFAQRPIVLFGKWRGEPSGTIKITGKTGSRDYAQNVKVSDVTPLPTNSAISYLWAGAKVERLMDYGADDTNQDAVQKEVTNLGLQYSMVTPYTSFVAVIDQVRNTDGKSTAVDQPLPLPQGVSNFAVGAEPGGMIFVAGVLLMLLIVFLYRVLKRRKQAVVGFALSSPPNESMPSILLRTIFGVMSLLSVCCCLYCFPAHVYPMSGLPGQQEVNQPEQQPDAKNVTGQAMPLSVTGQSTVGPAAKLAEACSKDQDQTTNRAESDAPAPAPLTKSASDTDNQLVNSVADVNNLVAITFDDGPYPKMTEQYLAVLQKYNVQATFFMVGRRVKDYPDLARQVVEQGNEIGGHSWTHARLDKMTAKDITEDMALVSNQVQTAAGQPVTLLRPPYGIYNDTLLKAAKQQGYRVILWDVDPRDWENPAPAKIVTNILQNVQPGSIIIMHEGHPNTLKALPIVIEKLRQQGLEPVTVSAMLNGQFKQSADS